MKLKSVLGFVWLLPATLLVWLFYVIPLLLTKQIKYNAREDDFIWSFELVDRDSWYGKMWSKWAGWSGPCVYIFKRYRSEDYPWLDEKVLKEYDEKTKIHEVRHCKQQFLFGIFHYPAYFLVSAWLTVSNLWKPYKNKKHVYLDNPFERDARRAAGQIVDVPRENWPDGPNDYNPWF